MNRSPTPVYTAHARDQMARRRIDEPDVEAVLKFGIRVANHRRILAHPGRKPSLWTIPSDVWREWGHLMPPGSRRLYVALGEDGVVVTAFRHRSIKSKVRERRPSLPLRSDPRTP